MKTKKLSKILSLLLALSMLVGMVPFSVIPASAADGFVEVSTYEQLRNEVDKGSAKIKLTADIDTTNENSGVGVTTATNLSFKGSGNVLDLNGHKLKLVSNMSVYFIEINSTDLTIKDSGTNGRIDFEYGGGVLGVQRAIFVRTKAGSLTVESGTLSSNYKPVVLIECFGNLTINGGKFYAPYSEGAVGAYVIHISHQYHDGAKTIINGGEIDGIVWIARNDSAATGTPNYGDIPEKINGGTFKQVVHLRWEENGTPSTPSGSTFEFSPAVEIAGGVFEGQVNKDPLDPYHGVVIPTKLTGGTFKARGNAIGLRGGSFNRKFYAKSLGNSIIMKDNEIRTSCYWSDADWFDGSYALFLSGSASDPVTVIPNAWGMKSVTLDGNPINYFKDWKGTVERMDNSTAHTLKFEWYPLASELVNAGYSYQTKCEHYISGSTAVQQTDTIAADKTSHTITIPAGVDPKVYSYDLQLNLQKDGSFVGIMSNEHIVKLVVNEAPVVEPDPTIDGTVYYTSGIVFGHPISIAASVTPAEATKSYQWQRSTDGGSTWTNIEGATSGRYTPVAADMGENVRIRVKVTAEGYLGEIVGAAVKVSKAANNGYPAVIQLEAVKNGEGTYTGFEITNFDSDCEYVYSTTSTPDWNANQITSATVTGLTSDTTYYVFARFKETATHTAGSIVSKNSIKLFENVPLQYVLLDGYDSGNTIYIKRGESVTLTVSADPSNANSWKEITFKDSSVSSLGTSNITISNEKIAASGTTATAFPNDHSITITGVSTGSATLDASYPSATSSAYGTWYVVVYDDSTVANALRLENVYTYADITLSENDEADLPTDLPKLLPENSGYHLEWRILKRGTTGFAHVTENDNIKLENNKIKPKAAHTGSEKTQLELVAVKDGSDTYKTLPKTSLFYVTVTAAPVIELTGLTVAPAKVNLELNATYQLSAVKEPVNAAGSLTWTSDKPAVAEVDNTGKVTAKAQGTAIITVTCGTKSASCTVTVGHIHDTDAQPWVYMDPGTHIKTCTAGDDFKVEAHDFSAWTKVDDTNHSRTCSKCKKSGETANYTETAEHTWVWVVDQEAALNQPGKQHEECTGCHAKRSENTVIPALRDYAVTVTGGTATVAAGTPITRAMEGVEVTVTADAPETGKVFDKWVVLEGNVTLANANSETTTFTMPASAVSVKATYKDAPHTHTFDQEIIKDAALKTAADCTHDAVYYKSCSCGAISTDDADTFTAINSALGHAWPEEGSWSKDADKHWYECSRCHLKKDEAAHDYGDDDICDICTYDNSVPHTHNLTLVDENPATCTTPGNKAYYTCDGCDKWFEDATGSVEITDKTSVILTANGHTPSGWKSDAYNHWKECTVVGCGVIIEDSKAAHTASEWITDTPATATTDGTKHKECTECGYVMETGTIPATGGGEHTHSYGSEWKTGADKHWHECSCGAKAEEATHTASDWITDTAATATTDGTKHKECTVCHRVLETDTIPATGSGEHTHSYSSDWKSDSINHWHECSCGVKDDVAAHSFKWVVDKEATATKKGSKHEECKFCGYQRPAVEIPATGSTTKPTDPTESNPNTGALDDVPQTGDNSNMILWIVLLLASGLGVTGTVVYSKRKKYAK